MKKSNEHLKTVAETRNTFTGEQSGFWVYPVDAKAERAERESWRPADADSDRAPWTQVFDTAQETRRETVSTEDSPPADPPEDSAEPEQLKDE